MVIMNALVLWAVCKGVSMNNRRQFVTISILLLIIISQVACEICYGPICKYSLVVNRNQNLIWKDPVKGLVFDVEYDDVNGRFQIAKTNIPNLRHFIGNEVDPKDIITTDGIKRSLITINGEFPAPTLEVTAGAQVVVQVVNKLWDETITVHWHGLDQRGTPWMDGVDFITQCPIQPLHDFTYRFIAEPAGTFWYHSHMGAQRNDGLKGMLIIHKGMPNVPYFAVMVTDWYHYDSHYYAATDPANGGSGGQIRGPTDRLVDGTVETAVVWQSALINGRGRAAGGPTWAPLTKFEVTPGIKHVFRVANSAGERTFKISIDSHKLRVTAMDGADVTPVVTDSIILASGGRVDFEIDTLETTDNYWMRAQTTKDLMADPTPKEVRAVVHYLGASESSEPMSSQRICSSGDPCTVVGCALLRYPASAHKSCYSVADLKHNYEEGERYKYGINSAEPDVEIFLNTRIMNNAAFNSYDFIAPTSPVYQVDSHVEPCASCPDDEICSCTHMIDIPFNKSVQIVISNFNLDVNRPFVHPHPIHMHGHHFAVLKIGFSDYKDYEPGDRSFAIASTPNPDLTCDDALCRHASWTSGSPTGLNTIDPPLLDTVTVPPSGYAVIRFRSDNPGPWLFHCHKIKHSLLRLILNIGQSHYPPVPPAMPICAAKFELSDDEFEDYHKRSLHAITYGGKFEKVSAPSGPSPTCPTVNCPTPVSSELPDNEEPSSCATSRSYRGRKTMFIIMILTVSIMGQNSFT